MNTTKTYLNGMSDDATDVWQNKYYAAWHKQNRRCVVGERKPTYIDINRNILHTVIKTCSCTRLLLPCFLSCDLCMNKTVLGYCRLILEGLNYQQSRAYITHVYFQDTTHVQRTWYGNTVRLKYIWQTLVIVKVGCHLLGMESKLADSLYVKK